MNILKIVKSFYLILATFFLISCSKDLHFSGISEKSLNLLKAIPPILLVISADIKDEIDQQKAARIAKKK